MTLFGNHPGEFAALLTAVFWTVTALAFEAAGKRIGSLQVNFLRLVFGFIFLSTFNLIRGSEVFPADATPENWLWLSLSGFAGIFLGDLFLFKSYTLIGSRFSMLIMTLVPPITALFSFIILDEHLSLLHFLGMMLTFGGISMAIFNRNGKGEKVSLKLAPAGLLYALGGAVGQAMGLVLSKRGLGSCDPFSATQIRIISGFAGFSVLITLMGRWPRVAESISDLRGMKPLALGSFFGPFLGISFSLIAVRYTEAGIASTIMALTPILIIAPAAIIYKEKVTFAEVAGAIISVGGVSLFFI
ncbi:MAG: EamA family transporter [Bacteroidales bacterium]|mgnify:CR=1 FL=1|jgi:drug/metabolite transporter (DMT)-like permease|nr:EamA family transporter [Bacteroidales bacterium]NMD03072.1 DMT family transporter [Bacteroidales bacterium]OQB65656.1 MAG: EamA-like transporter family protein [Bacteroidetes bacterium ADurb.Bin145]HOU02640.1 DMT family transporter [Bacteroidales bacterium]HQK67484.1 DMT family transporter [Bacteroidales bacterium]